MTPEILLKSSAYFNFEAPECSPILTTDIAHALAHLCRYNGHCKHFYSVAQHSVLASYLVPHEFALEALMHDAHEAFVGDVSSPLKQLLPDFQAIERRCEIAVRKQYNLPLDVSHEVKVADLRMLASEERDLLPRHAPFEVSEGYEPQENRIVPWSVHEARFKFMARFTHLRNRDAYKNV